MTARGIRNNNPLNIRRSESNKWQGLAARQTDRRFAQFAAREWGYRAAFCLIRTYMERRGANTLGKIVTRWAPPSDGNDTQAYIDFVSRTTGIAADRPLRFADQEAMVGIVRSMAQMESGVVEDERLLARAYCMAQEGAR